MKATDKFITKDGFEVSLNSLRSSFSELRNPVVYKQFRSTIRQWRLRFDLMTMADIHRQVQGAMVATTYLR